MYQYPYGNAQQLNLDWLMEQWQEVKQSIDGSLQGEIDRVEAAITDLLAARDAAVAAAGAANTSAGAAAASAQAAAADAATASAQAAAATQERVNAAQAANNAQSYAGTAQTQAAAAQNAAGQAAASASQAAADASDAHDDAVAAHNDALAAAGSASDAHDDAVAAHNDAVAAQAVLDSIPADYSELSDDVSTLNNAAFSDEIIPEIWSQGYWAIATGLVNATSGTWIKTTDFIYDDISRIYNNNSLLLYLQAWDKSSGNYVGTWNGNAFTTTYISGTGLTDINLDNFRENYPNYNFKITVTASDSSPITPETAGSLIHCIKSLIIYNNLQEEQRTKYYQQNLIEFYQTYNFGKTTIDNLQYIALDHNKITIEKNNNTAVSWVDVFFMLPYFQPYSGVNATLLSNYLNYFQPVYFNKITILGVNDKLNKTYACGLEIFTIQNGVLTSRTVTFNHTSGQKHTVSLTAEEEAAEKITVSFLLRSNEAETNNAEFIIGFENT